MVPYKDVMASEEGVRNWTSMIVSLCSGHLVPKNGLTLNSANMGSAMSMGVLRPQKQPKSSSSA